MPPRAGREEFAAVGLVCNLLTFGNLLLPFLLIGVNFSVKKILFVQTLPASLLAFWVGLALYSRRLHDFNLSLWWYIIYVCVTTGISLLSHMGAVLVSASGVLVWSFLALKEAPARENRFGETAEPFFPAVLANPYFI